MARPIGATTKRKTIKNKGIYASRLAKTNGEGSKAAWSKVAAAVKKGGRVDYKKEKV
jgi:hypothetical protein